MSYIYGAPILDLETSRMGAPYIYDISHLRVNGGAQIVCR
jgi:hypothetical protein